MGERFSAPNGSRCWRYWTKLTLVALVTGTLFSCVAPPWNWWPLSVVTLAPALIALRGARPVEWFFMGLVAGCVLGGSVCLGLAGRNLLGGVAVQFALGLLLSTWFLVTGFVANASPRRLKPWVPALTWPVWATACEVFGFSLSPTIGLIATHPEFVGILSWLGGVGLDSLVVAINIGLISLITSESRNAGIVTILFSLGVFACGCWMRKSHREGDSIEIRVLQPDLSASAYASVLWSPWTRRRIERDLDDMTEDAIAGGGELVIWPENGNSLSNAQLPRRQERLARLIGDTDAELLVVGPEFREQGMGILAFSMDRSGIRSVTRKQHLVPFEEMDVVPGRSRVLEGKHGAWAVAICFEAMFPALMRKHARDGAQLIVVTTDNATFIHSSMTQWHQAYSIRHALETGVPLVFASNRGPSAAWSANGRLLADTTMERRDILTATVPLVTSPSVAVKGGRLVLPLLAVMLLAAGLVVGQRRRHVAAAKSQTSVRIPLLGVPLTVGLSAGFGLVLHVAGVWWLLDREPVREARQLRLGSGAVDGLGPLYRQSGESSCGQAALAFALHMLGDEVVESDISNQIPHDPRGSTLADLERVARYRGFSTSGLRMNARDLQVQSGVAVLHVLGNHFVVAFEIAEGSLWIFDPSEGVITQVEREQLDSVWDGVALIVRPAPVSL